MRIEQLDSHLKQMKTELLTKSGKLLLHNRAKPVITQAGRESVHSQVTDILRLAGLPTCPRYVKFRKIGTQKGLGMRGILDPSQQCLTAPTTDLLLG